MRPSPSLWLLLTGSVLATSACFQDQINQGAARLSVAAAGQVVGLATSDEGCGFTSLGTMLFSMSDLAFADANDDGDGGIQATWAIDGCRVGSEEMRLADTNCVGDETYVKGLATVTGTQRVKLSAGLPPQIVDPHAVDIQVASADLFEVETYMIFGGDDEPQAKATFHHGHIAAEIEPALGESKSNPGTYGVKTTVAKISHVKLTNASLTIESDGNAIDVDIDDSDITAVTGPSFGADANTVSGTITIGGEVVDVTGALQDGLTEAQIDEQYACEDDLKGPVR